MEIDKLAQDLWCLCCDKPISLRFIKEEKLMGIASKLRIQCQNCLTIIEANSSSISSKDYYDSNIKLGIGKHP